MVKRICPKCGTPLYSSDESNATWVCEKCGTEIPKSEEREAE